MPRKTGQIKEVAVAITGASGAIYGVRLIAALLQRDCSVSLLLSDAGRRVLAYETGLDWSDDPATETAQVRSYYASDRICCFASDDFFAPLASGSSAPDAVVIVPCSMGTVGRLAAGVSDNLIERAADVALKERRDLVLVPRETPFNPIHLENLLRLSRAGAHILPAMPAFYQKPETLDDLVAFVVGKILDALGLDHDLFRRWSQLPGGEDA